MDNGWIVAFNAGTTMTNSGVTKMAGDGSLMGAAVPPQAVVRGLPGWLTPLLQSTALVLVLLGLAFASLPIYLCVPLALLVIWLPRLKKPALSLSSSDAADAIGSSRARGLEELVDGCERLPDSGVIATQCRLEPAERLLRPAS